MFQHTIRNRKILYTLCGFFAFVFIIIVRLFYLQIIQRNAFCALGERNYLRTEVILPLRGNLLDCNGVLLAANRPVFDLYWHGTGCWNTVQQDFLKKVEAVLDIDFTKEAKINMLRSVSLRSRRMLLKSDISFEQLCKVSEQCANSSNLVIKNSFKRIYPYKNMASHIVGYLGRDYDDYTKMGLSGLEKIFQDDLKGESGYILNVINSKGKKLFQKDTQDAKAGKDIALTLDYNLQKIAEKLFAPDQSGAFIIMDPATGDLKVFLSYPNFDPNVFLAPISQQDWVGKLSYNNPLLNRVTNAVYPPASLYKLVTFTAGLEEGIIECDTEFKCKGFVQFGGRKYHCIRHWGHGKIDLQTAVAYSCNIPCFEIAQKIKINTLAEYAYRLGLGSRTGFLLPEKPGLIPSYEWKVAMKNEPWWPGETFSASIGQSYNLVTPLQMVKMFSSIFTGYLVNPRILLDTPIEKKDLEISQKTLDFLRQATRQTVLIGSAKKLNSLKDFVIHAKTGTAQTSSLGRKRVNKNQLEHAWLSCYFQYKDFPPLTMIVLVENVGYSVPARDMAFKFLDSYRKLYE